LVGLDQMSGWAERLERAFGQDGLGQDVRASGALSPLVVGGVEMLCGGAPPRDAPAWQIRRVLEVWEELSPGGYTVMDSGPAACGGLWRVASWADLRVVVVRADPAGVLSLRAAAGELRELGMDFAVAVRLVRGGLSVAEVANGTGGEVIAVGEERSFVAGLVHGLTPGDRSKGKLAMAAQELAVLTGPGEPGPAHSRLRARANRRRPAADGQLPAGRGRLPGQRSSAARRRSAVGERSTGRGDLPGFNPAAFAEEW
jgi:hypothetical protein